MDPIKLIHRVIGIYNNRSHHEEGHTVSHPDMVGVDEAIGQEFQGLDAWNQYGDGFIAAFPDLKIIVTGARPHGNMVHVNLHAQGTFTGEMVTPDGTVPGNGNRFEMNYESEVEIKDGKVARWTNRYDMQEFMRQLGLD